LVYIYLGLYLGKRYNMVFDTIIESFMLQTSLALAVDLDSEKISVYEHLKSSKLWDLLMIDNLDTDIQFR